MDEQVCECPGYSGILGVSEDSDEDLVIEPLLAPSLEDVSILKRLGLSSCEEMTEEEVECAFGQCVMGFQCDQYTLTQRLRAEDHDRAVALNNLQVELQNTRHSLQELCECKVSGGEVREIVRQVEESLQRFENNTENIISTAENLGATHQEARVSCAVKVMLLHLENLKRRNRDEQPELQQCRQLLTDNTEDGEARQLTADRQLFTRRRVSITLIPTQSQVTDLEVRYQSCKSGDDVDTQECSGVSRCSVVSVGGSTDLSVQPTNEELTDNQEDTDRSLRCRASGLLKSDQSLEERESHDLHAVQSEGLVCVLQRPLLLCGAFILILFILIYIT